MIPVTDDMIERGFNASRMGSHESVRKVLEADLKEPFLTFNLEGYKYWNEPDSQRHLSFFPPGNYWQNVVPLYSVSKADNKPTHKVVSVDTLNYLTGLLVNQDGYDGSPELDAVYRELSSLGLCAYVTPEKSELEKIAEGKEKPIAIYHEGDAIAFYNSDKHIRDAWNTYAQREADKFNSNRSLDSYDSTDTVIGYDRDGKVTNWCPPSFFPEWKEHYLKGKSNV